ncbi:MAG: M23 family metallopeptidase [Novosphingobium sp.]|nr:M23 family metallopeptidase [Novosphingobium sp.]
MKRLAAVLALAASACSTGGERRGDETAVAVAPPPRTAPSPGVRQAAVRGPTAFAYAGELTQGGWIRGDVPRGTVALTLDGAPVEIAPDGRFLVAFDRDAGPVATLVARLGDGRSISATLAIAPRAWQVEHVAVSPRPALPSAEYQRLRKIELARIGAARRIVSGSQGWRQDFVWPAFGRISGRFGAQRIYRGTPGSYHSGVDVSTGQSGSPYVAPADGVVILAAEAPFTLEGNLLMIDHGNGLNSAFLHSAKLLVKTGETVRRGQAIGTIGMTGRATGPHLHWSLKWREARLDPLLFAGPMPTR